MSPSCPLGENDAKRAGGYRAAAGRGEGLCNSSDRRDKVSASNGGKLPGDCETSPQNCETPNAWLVRVQELIPMTAAGIGRGWRGRCARSPALSCQTLREGSSETRDKIPSQKAFDKLQKATIFQPPPPLPVSQLETRPPQKELSNFFLAVERITSVLIPTLKCWMFEL